MTAEEAMKAAKLDYQVTLQPLYRHIEEADENGEMETIAEEVAAYATVNSHTNDVLGIVGPGYTPLQNADCFSFFDAVLGKEEARYECAGAIGLGQRTWLLVAMPDVITPVKGDEVRGYILLVNSHDGSLAVQARTTPIRVVCENTLNMALRGDRSFVSLKHTTTVKERLELAGEVVAAFRKNFTTLGETFGYLAKHKINDAWIEEYQKQLFGDLNKTPEGAAKTRLSKKLDEFEKLLEEGNGVNLKGVKGTAWWALNAATEWADYFAPSKTGTDKASLVLFGSAAEFKQKALSTALALTSK
jgi:phage/plasmid-like protein (TIGR03299 family)